MDEALKQAAAQVPGLVVMAVVVLAFLKYIKSRDDFIKQMHDEHIEARKESRLAISENANATRENTSALRDLKDTVRSKT